VSHRKPPGRRQNRTKARLTLVRGAQPAKRATPPAPAGLLRRTQDAWRAFWGSDVADLVQDQDLEAVLRLFELYDERIRLWRAFRKTRLVAGSKGQPALNPVGPFAVALGREINALEKQLAITPRARIQVGLQVLEAREGLEDLAHAVNDAVDDDADEDPRLTTTRS